MKKKIKNKLSEDKILNQYLKKLHLKNKLTFNFENDASIVKIPKNKEIVISQDTLVEKIHFFSNDPASSIAIKSLRANLSDLVSMGASPHAYTMSLSLNNSVDKLWLKNFSNSLYKEQKKYNLYLMGGDIVKSKYLSITITILGVIDKGKYIKRNSAKINDDIWVTGNIGDSYIGHKLLKKRIIIKNINKKKYFINSYYYPNPPVALSIKLGKFMTSAIDISDGFIGDLEKITVNFKKGANIFLKNIPYSNYCKFLINNKVVSVSELLCGGDDYQLLFTAKVKNRPYLYKLSSKYKIKFSRVGKITKSKKLNLLGYNITSLKKSYKHFI